MAFVEMQCKCDSAIQLDFEDNDDAVWMMVIRFANAHVECGYVAPVPEAPDSTPDGETEVRIPDDDK